MAALVLPNFVIAGTQKAGTTTLFDILKQHPDIYLPEQKEAHFFDREEAYSKGLEWYSNHFFAHYNQQKAIGTVTPGYLFHPQAANRLGQHLGTGLKLIFIFRHPADRAYSHYLMQKRRVLDELDFESAIQEEQSRIAQDEWHRNKFSYTSRSHYPEQIERFLQVFDRKNFLFLRFEADFIQNREATVQTILDFLAVQQMSLNTNIKSNAAGESKSATLTKMIRNPMIRKIGKKILGGSVGGSLKKNVIEQNTRKSKAEKLNDATRKMLMETVFKGETEQLEHLTGLDLTNWKA